MTDIIESEPAPSEEAGFASDLTQSHSLGESVQAYITRIRGGEMGALPSIFGLVVLFIVFNFANDRFLSNLNFANLMTQSGSIIILAMALVPVLLLGEIDLSAGIAGGVLPRSWASCSSSTTRSGSSRCSRHWSSERRSG